ncbi:hypothetical protein YYC_05336 [Plasmodium yoelii 17X]|uniref:Fam-b protein n=1 Tax=Plasmodium yoelii 17X TaxID=1323249 RepID=V7PC39_PLAYE|nr:hypothetical protein YYC_05336 [Plasmodium yoelii 17X]
MRARILKYVFFSIVICSFEYAKNELYFVNDRGIHLERNVINFRNNRILSDADNQFDLNEFYESTLSLVSQFNDYNGGNKEIEYLRNIIYSHIKKRKESNTSFNLKNVDSKTKKLINKFRKELEELTKELDNKINGELAIQPIHDKIIIKKNENSSVSEHALLNLKNADSKTKKLINMFRKELEGLTKELDNKINGELEIQPIHDERIIKKDENSSASKHEDFKQLENYKNSSVSEHKDLKQLKNDEYNEITSNSNNKKFKFIKKLKKELIKLTVSFLGCIVIILTLIPGPLYLMVLYILFF